MKVLRLYGLRATSILLIIVGLWMIAGGAWLITLGGSFYYLPAGIACVVCAILLWRRPTAAAMLYVALVIITSIWAVAEVGLDFWQLLPRIGGPLIIAGWLLPLALTGLSGPDKRYRLALILPPFAVAVLLLVAFLTADPSLPDHQLTQHDVSRVGATDDWLAWGRTAGGSRYAPAMQITPANVAQLQPVWTYHTGDLRSADPLAQGSRSTEVTPLKVGNTLFLCTPRRIVAAIDADTGKQRWRYDPKNDLTGAIALNCRGVSYHKSTSMLGVCRERILIGTLDERLIALDARTGRLCPDFGNRGTVTLRSVTVPAPGSRFPTSPPAIIGDLAIIGSFVRDNVMRGEPSGVVRAFNVHSGKLVWAWDSGRPDNAPAPSAGEDYVRGSPNAWSVFSADPKLGLVYVPTGNATPDFVNGFRDPTNNRYASSIVALDVTTGKVRWHFQTTHLDIWDYDVPAQPVLFDMPMGQHSVPALAAATKRGEIFILDRKTGRPLTTVEERAAPSGKIPGERYSATQPYSTGFPSMAPPRLTEHAMWGATPLDQLWCRIKFRSFDYAGDFTPPSIRGSIQYPGNFGAINWGSVSIDEGRHLLLTNSSSLPLIVKLVPRAEADRLAVSLDMHDGLLAQKGTPYAVRLEWMLSPLGFPCTAPPWGMMMAVDLDRRRILWKRPLGTTADHAPLGIAVPGVFNLGGSVVTRSGLVFIGAALDAYLRAFDVRSGRELWRGRLPGGGQATPMTYVSEETGRQYVVISAGGSETVKTVTGDSIVAFALPPLSTSARQGN